MPTERFGCRRRCCQTIYAPEHGSSEREPLPMFFEVAPDADGQAAAAIGWTIGADVIAVKTPIVVCCSAQLHGHANQSRKKSCGIHGLDSIRTNAEASLRRPVNVTRVCWMRHLEFFLQPQIGARWWNCDCIRRTNPSGQLVRFVAATAPWVAVGELRLNYTLRDFVGGAGDLIRSAPRRCVIAASRRRYQGSDSAAASTAV